MQKKLYEANKAAAQDINEIDPDNLGPLALRKVSYTTPQSSLKALMQVGRDLVFMASKLQEQS